MIEDYPAGAYDLTNTWNASETALLSFADEPPPCAPTDAIDAETAVLYRQMSYEELEECVFIVRDSISEFYLAPQGEISFAAVDAAVEAAIGDAKKNNVVVEPPVYKHVAPVIASQLGDETLQRHNSESIFIDFGCDQIADSNIEGFALVKTALDAYSDAYSNAYSDDYSNANSDDYSIDSLSAPAALAAPVSGESAIDQQTAAGHFEPLAEPVAPDKRDEDEPDHNNRVIGRNAYQPHTIPVHQIYRESIRKRVKKRRASTLKYLAASFCGALFGGFIVLFFFSYVLPAFGNSFLAYQPDSVHSVIHTFEYAIADTQIEAIFEKVSPSIVGIRVTTAYDDFIFGQQRGTGDGSGIIIHSDGYILTNYNVITSALPAYVPIPRGGDSQGARAESNLQVVLQGDTDTVYAAKLVARDNKTGIAVIKIDAANLPVAELGDSDQLKHGEMVIAIGRPVNMNNLCSVTDGIVSGFNSNADFGADREASFIQTSAAINAGSSGGALVNSKGQVIGINVNLADSSGNSGMNYAIPINSVKLVAENLIDFSYVRGRAKTGIGYSESFNDDYDYYQRQYPEIPRGVYVDYVEPMSGAFIAGIKVGDVITKMRGETVTDYLGMLDIKDTLTPGEVIEVEVFRAGEYINMMLEVSEETGDDPGFD